MCLGEFTSLMKLIQLAKQVKTQDILPTLAVTKRVTIPVLVPNLKKTQISQITRNSSNNLCY